MRRYSALLIPFCLLTGCSPKPQPVPRKVSIDLREEKKGVAEPTVSLDEWEARLRRGGWKDRRAAVLALLEGGEEGVRRLKKAMRHPTTSPTVFDSLPGPGEV